MSYSPDNRGENALTACLAAATGALETARAKLAELEASDSAEWVDIKDARRDVIDLEREIEYLEERLG